MRRLFLILLFISSYSNAEKFNLVCDVKKEYRLNNYAPVVANDVLGIVVHDEYIQVDGLTISNRTPNLNELNKPGILISGYYLKNQQKIVFDYISKHKTDKNEDLGTIFHKGEIDRLTGEIFYKTEFDGVRTSYLGVCKKSERAF